MWEELLKEVIIIKWGVLCIAFSIWCFAIYFLCKEIPVWWRSFDKEGKKKKERFTLEKMKDDLAKSCRPRTDFPTTKWD